MFISAIIPTFNSSKTAQKAVNSLLIQTQKVNQIIVVDNGSTDKTYSNLQSKFGNKIKLVRNEANLGVTGGRNSGIKYLSSKTDWVLFFDHDMTADKNMVKQLVAVAISKQTCGIITPKIFYSSYKKQIWSAGTGINLLTGQVLFRGGYDNGQYNQIEEVEVAPAVMLVKSSVLQKINGFDDKYFATFEDTDFCFRAKKAGYSVYYSPLAIAYHDLPFDKTGESKRLVKRMYWVGRNRILFMKDFGRLFPVFLIFLVPLAGYYFLLCTKYGSISDYWQFLKGTVDGLRYK